MSTTEEAELEVEATAIADVETPQAPSQKTLKLYDVERALGPLRRTATFAARQPDGVRFLELTCMRFVERLLSFPLPASVAVDVADLAGQLTDIDALQGDERLLRIGEVNALVARIDAMLGLPLERLRFRRTRKQIYPRRQQELPKEPPAPAEPTQAEPAVDELDSALDLDAALAVEEPTRARNRPRRAKPKVRRDPGPPPPPPLPSGPWSMGEGIGGVELAERGLPDADVDELATAGLKTATDLFRLQPQEYETLRPVHGAGRDIPEGRAALGGRMRARFTAIAADGTRHTQAVIRGAELAHLTFPDALPACLLKELTPGTRVVAVGVVAAAQQARMQRVDQVELTAGHTQKLAELAGYEVEGVSDRTIRRAIRATLADLDSLRDPLPDDVVRRQDLMSLGDALTAVHAGTPQRRRGHRRLAFEEATYAQLGLALTHTPSEKSTVRGIAHPVLHQHTSRLTTWRDVEVDDAHLAAFELVKRELRGKQPMLRVLAGRPGDQRERVALLAAVTVAESKSQVLWLFPEPIMAEALYTQYEPMLRELGLVSRLLPDEPSRSVKDALRRGEVHVVFGSLDLTKADLQFRRLGLVIAHESDPGQLDHTALVQEGTARPDCLVVPSRAIGAGHLLGPYAEYGVTWVQPHKWPRFHTMLVAASQREEAYEQVRQALDEGAQAMIVLPMGRTGDLLEPEEAVRVRTTVESHLPGARIQLFHGALSREERNRRFADFQRRRIDVLLATHAVEFGASTPGATELVVEQADRMPRERLARLMHRLVGVDQPTVRLIHGDDPNPDGMRVLELLRKGRIDDALSGDTFSTEEPRLSWMDAGRDVDLLLAAREVALGMLKADPQLKHAKSRSVAHALSLWWPGLFSSECPIHTPKGPAGGGNRRRRRRRRRR